MEVGSFWVGDRKICTPSYLKREYADLPEVGERILFFLDTEWNNRGLFLDGNSTDVLTVRSDGTVSLPKAYQTTEKSLADADVSNVLEYIRSFVFS